MGIGPILSWGKEEKLQAFKKVIPSIFVTIAMTVIIFSIYQSYTILGIAGIILAFWIISGTKNIQLE